MKRAKNKLHIVVQANRLLNKHKTPEGACGDALLKMHKAIYRDDEAASIYWSNTVTVIRALVSAQNNCPYTSPHTLAIVKPPWD
ncbi:MAG: hypothetical protein COA78_34840 [Blastopirellula sp.]|nr:MAG: hypothetical protein COA78_34840 [Blastopirellula sp.]